jgi:hypothetical protein
MIPLGGGTVGKPVPNSDGVALRLHENFRQGQIARDGCDLSVGHSLKDKLDPSSVSFVPFDSVDNDISVEVDEPSQLRVQFSHASRS